MAKQITQLPVAASLAASDVFPLDQSGTTKQATLSVIADGLPSATGTGGLVRQGYPVFSTGFATNAINGISNSSSYAVVGGAGLGPSSGGFVSFFGGAHATNPGLLQLGTNGVGILHVLPGGNVGLGTLSPSERLSVAGNIRLANSNGGLLFTDTGSTSPYMVSSSDGNFYFTGTNAAGAGRVVFQCLMRSNTSPFVVYPPLQIGASGSPIQNVIVTAFNHTPATIAANGGIQTLDVTVTGASSSGSYLVNCPGGLSNDLIILKANYISTNTARVYWINPTASSITLAARNYNICVINF